MQNLSARTWIWIAIVVQFVGYVFDALWHGLLHPGVESKTVGEMARHLATVHLPLYLGAAAVLGATGTALLRQARRPTGSLVMPIAFGGALLSTAAEVWHAYSHLQLDLSHAPIAGILSLVGFLVVVATMTLSRARQPRGADDTRRERRAA